MGATDGPFPIPREPSYQFPGYRLVRQISETTMSSVYLAEDIDLRRHVVLKLLSRRPAAERFKREVVMAARLDHPNIVPVYASGEIGGRLYLVLRHVPGGDLGALLRTRASQQSRSARPGRLDLHQTTGIIGQAAAALDAAHRVGMVHRGVKPGNILVDAHSGHVYLADFGIARAESAEPGRFPGDYAAPEQVIGGPVDRRADVYALGAVLYECLTGSKPYGGKGLTAVLWSPPPRVTDHCPELDPRIDTIVATALAKRPEDRFATCGEVATAVAALNGVARHGHATRRHLPASLGTRGAPDATANTAAGRLLCFTQGSASSLVWIDGAGPLGPPERKR
ncbi:serine/threonine-protein kinase [Actinomadura fulvescens]|uniref:non-specific serine/threonine protein kinase n=2 Tax=Actinomadura fulvescens TaxID=46160 RepID=A0ABN3PIE8_9ACTN